MDGSVSFAADIRPLFRDSDIAAMKRARGMDLGDYGTVSARADDILDRLSSGDMPCDSAWPDSQVDLFRRWIADGKRP